jgi:hypothetical protein
VKAAEANEADEVFGEAIGKYFDGDGSGALARISGSIWLCLAQLAERTIGILGLVAIDCAP